MNSKAYDITDESLKVLNQPFDESKAAFAVFDIKDTIAKTGRANIGATYNSIHQYGIIPPPLLYADRKITGMLIL